MPCQTFCLVWVFIVLGFFLSLMSSNLGIHPGQVSQLLTSVLVTKERTQGSLATSAQSVMPWQKSRAEELKQLHLPVPAGLFWFQLG